MLKTAPPKRPRQLSAAQIRQNHKASLQLRVESWGPSFGRIVKIRLNVKPAQAR